MAIENPTIIIPGIKGSSLENYYSLEPDPTWSEFDAAKTMSFGPRLEDLALGSTGSFDGSLRVITRANGLLPIAYGPLVNALRQRRKLPVYVFPYDWRYSVGVAAVKLAELVNTVHAKMSAAKKRGAAEAATWGGKIDFVCHSMGGLVFQSFLNKSPAKKVGRVVFLAVPHRGSLDAVEAMIRGETVLFWGRKEMRKLARTFPGAYELLPRIKNALVDGAGKELSAFKVKNWQQNVTPTGTSGPETNGFDVEQEHLDAAKAVLDGLKTPLDVGIAASEVLTIYGDRPNSTLIQVRVGDLPDREYDFDDKKKAIKGNGDGVVPSHSALLKGIQAVKLTWDDVSYFGEMTTALHFHAFIGSLDETQTITGRFLAGEDDPNDPKKLLPRGLGVDRYNPSPNPMP